MKHLAAANGQGSMPPCSFFTFQGGQLYGIKTLVGGDDFFENSNFMTDVMVRQHGLLFLCV
jgi:hypothetical protein